MKALILLFWQMLRFKRGPEDAPYSTYLLMLVIGCNFAVTATGQWIARPSQANMALMMPIISLAVELIFMALLLNIKQLGARFVQTETSVLACDTLLTLAVLPLLMIGLSLPAQSPKLTLLGLVEVVVLTWAIAMRGFIYHRALNISPFLGYLLAFMLLMFTLSITIKIFPELLTQATAAAIEASKPR